MENIPRARILANEVKLIAEWLDTLAVNTQHEITRTKALRSKYILMDVCHHLENEARAWNAQIPVIQHDTGTSTP